MTTVGYGDIVPKTPTGRWAAVVIMLTGVAVLGLLAGSLASFFRLEKGGAPGGAVADGDASDAIGTSGASTDPATALGALVTEVAALRQQVARVVRAPRRSRGPSGRRGGGPQPEETLTGRHPAVSVSVIP